ncbi:hypothetical protein ULVI_06905 [Cochleicola gelatinilyticus]|uniref:Uncharacterized protein n=1 Tax=Cochleicola gelatinilyticus TaxID=1763537 RepID=A0A167J9H2_9FLAO|nr:hypothetical protein ULVI_06905 [Cochleicola gelatinilyticus]
MAGGLKKYSFELIKTNIMIISKLTNTFKRSVFFWDKMKERFEEMRLLFNIDLPYYHLQK